MTPIGLLLADPHEAAADFMTLHVHNAVREKRGDRRAQSGIEAARLPRCIHSGERSSTWQNWTTRFTSGSAR
ncbi:hypothetical protein [Burkholderia ambifaria]|uniref:hypothetical protein n=1 Tax=Burkholderia ambifaria TaxID=152480 RepID=UPI00158833C7|nr:hypothetical protein [Burkholderia ambifaria]MBR8345986.1 hypothetical protein [Burkholderia ambifaria]